MYGGPTVGIGNTYVLSLRDQRVGTDQRALPGAEIGVARVYDSWLESGSYDNANANLNLIKKINDYSSFESDSFGYSTLFCKFFYVFF